MSLELCQGPRRRGAAWVQVGVPAGHLLSAFGAPENLHSSEGGWDQEGASCQDWRARGLDGTGRGTALGQSSGTLEQGGCQFTRKPARPCVQTRCLESPEEPSPYPRDKPGAVLWGTRTDGRATVTRQHAGNAGLQLRCLLWLYGAQSDEGVLWRNRGAQDPSWGAPAGSSTWMAGPETTKGHPGGVTRGSSPPTAPGLPLAQQAWPCREWR